MINYGPLWETMKSKDVSQYCLLNHGIDNKTLDSQNITMLTLEKLCAIIGCSPNDVVEFK